MSYDEHLNEHLRSGLLRLLAKQPGYRANDSVLRDAAERIGFALSRDALKVQLDWLAEQGMVKLDKLERLWVVTATGRGIDVAQGRAFVTGIVRPSAD